MPRVPQLETGVKPAIRPRVQEPFAPEAAFQSGMAEAAEALGQGLLSVADAGFKIEVMRRKEQEEQDRVLLAHWKNELDTSYSDLATTLKQRSGIEAFGSTEEFSKQRLEVDKAIFGQVPEHLRDRLMAYAEGQDSLYHRSLYQHESQMMTLADKQATDGALANITNTALETRHVFGAVEAKEAEYQATVAEKIKGLPEEAAASEALKLMGHFHGSLVEAYAQDSKPLAMAYLEKNQDKMPEVAYLSYKEKLKHVSDLELIEAEALRVASSGKSAKEKRDMVYASAVLDAEGRAKAWSMVQTREREDKAFLEDAEEKRVNTLADRIQKGEITSASQIPLDLDRKNQDYLFNLLKRGTSEWGYDPVVYDELSRLSPSELLAVDLRKDKYLSGLGKSKWSYFSNLQRTISAKRDSARVYFQRNLAYANDALKAAGINPYAKAGKPDAVVKARFIDLALRQLTEISMAGELPDPTKLQDIYKALLAPTEVETWHGLWTKEVPAIKADPEDIVVDKDEREQIVESLVRIKEKRIREEGRQPTEEELQPSEEEIRQSVYNYVTKYRR